MVWCAVRAGQSMWPICFGRKAGSKKVIEMMDLQGKIWMKRSSYIIRGVQMSITRTDCGVEDFGLRGVLKQAGPSDSSFEGRHCRTLAEISRHKAGGREGKPGLELADRKGDIHRHQHIESLEDGTRFIQSKHKRL